MGGIFIRLKKLTFNVLDYFDYHPKMGSGQGVQNKPCTNPNQKMPIRKGIQI